MLANHLLLNTAGGLKLPIPTAPARFGIIEVPLFAAPVSRTTEEGAAESSKRKDMEAARDSGSFRDAGVAVVMAMVKAGVETASEEESSSEVSSQLRVGLVGWKEE